MSAALHLPPWDEAPRLQIWTCRWCLSPMESERIPVSCLCPRCEPEYEARQEQDPELYDDSREE